MPARNVVFEKDQPFHIIARTVEGRDIFVDEADCYRFIFQIYAANVGKPNTNLNRLNIKQVAQAILRGEDVSDEFVIKEHPPLVHILDFALNINHYHFYMVSASDNAIPVFMQKLNMGFAKFFNLKYGRKGALFGSRYVSVPIETDLQSDTVGRYISIINPLDIYQPGWRENGLSNGKEALVFLENYQFSSFPEKIGKRKSKLLAPEEILHKYHADGNYEDGYQDFVKDFLQHRLAFDV